MLVSILSEASQLFLIFEIKVKLWIVSVSESVDVRKTCRMGTNNTVGESGPPTLISKSLQDYVTSATILILISTL